MALVQVQLGAIPLAIRRAIMVAEFIAADVCRILEVGPEQVRRLDDDEYTLFSTQGIEGAKNPQMNIVSEAGLYSLVLGSRKKEAM